MPAQPEVPCSPVEVDSLACTSGLKQQHEEAALEGKTFNDSVASSQVAGVDMSCMLKDQADELERQVQRIQELEELLKLADQERCELIVQNQKLVEEKNQAEDNSRCASDLYDKVATRGKAVEGPSDVICRVVFVALAFLGHVGLSLLGALRCGDRLGDAI